MRTLARSFVSQAAMKTLFATFVFLALLTSAKAVEIKEVVSPKGIKALLVEDYTVPIISMSFSFDAGTTQDPKGKEGLVTLLSTLMDEGSGPYDNKQFQARSEEIGLEMNFNAGRDKFTGRVRTLKSEADNAFEMVRLALNEPRFDNDAIERMRDALTTRLLRNKRNPGFLLGRKLRASLYGDHPYARSGGGTEASLAALTGRDVAVIRERIMARDILTVGVVGAISEAELGKLLDTVFGELPENANLVPVAEAQITFGEEIRVDFDRPQTAMTLVYPAYKRSHPDFFAVHLMNHILGGGTFSSWLYDEVREKRGLAYSASSSVASRDHAAVLFASTSTRNDRAGQALSVIREQIKRMVEEGPTQAELDLAKKFVIGTYAVSNLDTSTKIASVLVAIQNADLGIDYIDRRQDYISAVTLDDVKRVARDLLSGEPTIAIVGPAGS